MSYGPNVIHECPPHRRIDADGHPTVTDLEDWIRTNQPSSIGLLVVERKELDAVYGNNLFTTRRL